MIKPRRILITGSRELVDRSTVSVPLTQAWNDLGREHCVVVHGTATGADNIAGGVARDNPDQLTEERHPADWRPGGVYNNRAGIDRNQEMVNLGADLCLAFLKQGAKNIGTRHCIRIARAAGIEVREYVEE